MIVPCYQLECTSSKSLESRVDECCEMLRATGIFGRVAIWVSDSNECKLAETIALRLGGQLDVYICSTRWDEEGALKWLNAGASKVFTENRPVDTVVPDDRIGLVSEVQLMLKTVTADEWSSVSELWLTDQDCWVDADILNDSRERLASSLIGTLKSDRVDGLWPTVIVDPLGVALGLAYSSRESLTQAIVEGVGVYYSRSRDEIWVKGKTSGAVQTLLNVAVDCDFDTLRFTVDQGAPGFCHKQTHSCFGADRSISEIVQRLEGRIVGDDTKSFTRKLFDDPEMLRVKLLEEAQELSDANSTSEAAWEAADVLYFSLIALMRNGSGLNEVYQELARRMQRVVRRKNKLEQQ